MATKVINETGREIILREGTNNNFREIKKLGPGDSWTTRVDKNATHRDYRIAAEENDPHAITLTSDDFTTNKKITIFYDSGTQAYHNVMVPRNPKGFFGSLKDSVVSFFKKGDNTN